MIHSFISSSPQLLTTPMCLTSSLLSFLSSLLPSLFTSSLPLSFLRSFFLQRQISLLYFFFFLFYCFLTAVSHFSVSHSVSASGRSSEDFVSLTFNTKTSLARAYSSLFRNFKRSNIAPILAGVVFCFVKRIQTPMKNNTLLYRRLCDYWSESTPHHHPTPPPHPSSGTSDSCYVSFIFKQRGHPAALPVFSAGRSDGPQSRETGNGAERRDSPARDWNQSRTLTNTRNICSDRPNHQEAPFVF